MLAISGIKVFALQLSLFLALVGEPYPDFISNGLLSESFMITYFSQLRFRDENASLTKS